jgi:hypothetical protein
MLCKFIAYKQYRKLTLKNWLWLIFGAFPMVVILGLTTFIVLKFSKDVKK